ncbi:monovalent cation/H(+) antiporter subunit G [Actinopolymorpha pittospori]|uniref:Multicomponent Na+:H+ antiporter subunit G n=1 Tax=Actinopolymorpha pittospori TaxID=648752 RepID=A0A927MUM2_9ACTN|nr:monovalent cation/H(+) antiporter subunit G [Actinopolymorpha pittospori]MBE1606671.1 multicomponent Na+:H+ antiporter subunit G [Actinopolymorpha pittospori]
MREWIVAALIALGLLVSLSGVVGILRMPDLYTRIQCSTKNITMGTLPALIALVVGMGASSTYGSRALLVAVLLLVMNPVASHALVRAAYKTGVPMWRGAVLDQVRPDTVAPRRASGAPGEPEEET